MIAILRLLRNQEHDRTLDNMKGIDIHDTNNLGGLIPRGQI